jgi:tellurite resistance protein
MTTITEGRERLFEMLAEIGGSPDNAKLVLRELVGVLTDEEFLPDDLHTSEVIVAVVVLVASMIHKTDGDMHPSQRESLPRFIEMLGGVLGVTIVYNEMAS